MHAVMTLFPPTSRLRGRERRSHTRARSPSIDTLSTVYEPSLVPTVAVRARFASRGATFASRRVVVDGFVDCFVRRLSGSARILATRRGPNRGDDRPTPSKNFAQVRSPSPQHVPRSPQQSPKSPQSASQQQFGASAFGSKMHIPHSPTQLYAMSPAPHEEGDDGDIEDCGDGGDCGNTGDGGDCGYTGYTGTGTEYGGGEPPYPFPNTSGGGGGTVAGPGPGNGPTPFEYTYPGSGSPGGTTTKTLLTTAQKMALSSATRAETTRKLPTRDNEPPVAAAVVAAAVVAAAIVAADPVATAPVADRRTLCGGGGGERDGRLRESISDGGGERGVAPGTSPRVSVPSPSTFAFSRRRGSSVLATVRIHVGIRSAVFESAALRLERVAVAMRGGGRFGVVGESEAVERARASASRARRGVSVRVAGARARRFVFRGDAERLAHGPHARVHVDERVGRRFVSEVAREGVVRRGEVRVAQERSVRGLAGEARVVEARARARRRRLEVPERARDAPP